MTTRLTGGILGSKAITLSDIDSLLDAQINRGDGTDPQELYATVAWTFWATVLRANSVSQIPYNVYPESVAKKDETEENAEEYEIDLVRILWQVEAWLQLHGAAYVLKRSNQVIVKKLQVLNANTMRVHKVDDEGPTVFRQQIGAKITDYPADEILYFRSWSPFTDIRPGVAGGGVGGVASELIKNTNQWATSFFVNGAVPAILLVSDDPLNPNIAQEVEQRWDKMLKGVRNFFRTKAFGHGLKPMVVGQPVKDLAMPELEKTKRHQVVAAHNVPPGLSDTSLNKAERDALEYELFAKWVIPWCMAWIVPVLNEELFAPERKRISFQYRKIEAVQKEEIAKAEMLAFAANGIIIPAYEANLVSIKESRSNLDVILKLADLPGLEKEFTPEQRAPEPAPGRQAGEGPGNSTPPGSNTGVNTQPRPKALPPEWGRRRVSTTN